jgi:glycosyltransferase involved in cell wall biosynthesis
MSKKYKRLAIISDCIHMQDADGTAVTENHVYCRQMQMLASYFEQTFIVCPFIEKKKNNVTTAYTLPSIKFLPLPNAGGQTFRDKLNLVRMIPVWVKAFRNARRNADVFYLRMPNNLNIPGFFYFHFIRAAVFATYTGTWNNYKGEPLTYRFQKWLLKNLFKGPVWIYTGEPKNDEHLFESISPSFSEAEWNAESVQVETKKEIYKSGKLIRPVFITVGALVPNKNQQFILEVCKYLKGNNFSFYWYIVGDGYMRDTYEQFVKENELDEMVCIAGKKTYEQLQVLYREANFIVQATLVEGFGKAPVEAMCHGVIPLLSKTALAEIMTGNGNRGFMFDGSEMTKIAELIITLSQQPQRLVALVDNGRQYVKDQTLERWASALVAQIDK